MSKKENEREVSGLLARLRESLKWPKKAVSEDAETADSEFDKELSDRLGKHLQDGESDRADELAEGEDEPSFDVEELEIVADGTLDPAQAENEISDSDVTEEQVAAAEEALLSDLDALMARMTPEQRARFEQEMNTAEDAADEPAFGRGIPNNMELTDQVVIEDDGEEPAESEQTAAENEAPVSDDVGMTDEEQTIVEPERVEAEQVPAETKKPARKAKKAQAKERAPMEAPVEVTASDIEPTESEGAPEEEPIEEYIAPEEDEEYDLPEVEAFRALEARMTPEQREQFEQAMLEAQEAEKAEKAARRAARQQAALNAKNAELVVQDNGDWVFGEADLHSTAEEAAVPVADKVIDDVAAPEAEEVADEVASMSGFEPDETTDDMEAVAIAADAGAVFTEAPGMVFEPVPVEESELPAETEAVEEEPSEEASIFFSVEEGTEGSDMPAIKVGAELSSFILVEEPEPEPEPEPEDEEAALAALLARMSPEQLERFRETMLAEEETGGEEPAETVLSEEPMPPMTEENVTDEPAAFAPQELEEEAVVVTPATEETVTATESIPEEDEPEVVEESAQQEDPLAAILNDPEKLEELLSRLTPEQAAEMERVLHGDEESVFDDAASEEGISETEEETHFEEEENSEETILWSTPLDEEDKIPLDDILDEQNTKFAKTSDLSEETDEENEEDELLLMEISEDMTDEEVSLMLGLGYEKELVYKLGRERVEQVKKRAARENARDPDFADAYAYEGQEYRLSEQTDRIRYRYGKERRHIWFRLIGTSIFALLLFLYECCGVFRGAFGGIFDPAHYPVIAIMAGWQLLVFASVFSWKQLFRGIRSAFVLEPDSHAMTAVIVAAVMFNNILMAIVFKGSSLYLYNFPAALCLVCSVLCDFADVCREELTFEVVSSPASKYVAEAITLNEEVTDMPTMPLDAETVNPLTQKNAMYVRRAGFVKNYFRRTNRKTKHRQILNFVFLPLLAFAVVMGIVTALIGNGTAPALSTVVVTVLLCMPLSYTVIHTLPLFYETRRLHKQGCAIVGEGTVEECNAYSTVIFEDKELFPPVLIKTKGLKLYENNLIYSVILKISILFREIGGPINEVLDLDKEEMKRFLASGKAGALAEGKVLMERMTDEGVLATLNDGSHVVAGSAAFLQSQGVFVRPSTKDQQLLESGDMSILYLAFDGKLSARFYVDYQPDPEFEAMAGMLHEDEFRVAVRTLDPGIHDEMIAHKCQDDTPDIHTVRAAVRELTERPSGEAKVDSGLICGDDPRKMLLPLRAIRNLRRLHRFGLRLYTIALIINVIVTIILTACSVAGYMPSLFVSLYMLVWLATSLVLTALFLNK